MPFLGAGAVSNSGHDGPQLCSDSRDLSVFIWLPQCQTTVRKDCDDLQALF